MTRRRNWQRCRPRAEAETRDRGVDERRRRDGARATTLSSKTPCPSTGRASINSQRGAGGAVSTWVAEHTDWLKGRSAGARPDWPPSLQDRRAAEVAPLASTQSLCPGPSHTSARSSALGSRSRAAYIYQARQVWDPAAPGRVALAATLAVTAGQA